VKHLSFQEQVNCKIWVYLYIYGSMQFVVGLLVDHYGFARVFLTGGLLLCAGSVFFPLAHGLPLLYASRALVGFGCSMIYMSIVKAIDRLFAARHFAPLLGFFLFLGYSGGLFATYPFAALVLRVGWRNGLLLVALGTILAYSAAASVLRRTQASATRAPQLSFHNVGAILRNRTAYPIFFAAALNFAIYFVSQATLGKKLLADCFQSSSQSAATATFLMMLTCMTATVVSGILVRLTNHRYRALLVGTTALNTVSSVLILAALQGTNSAWAVRAGYLLLAVAGSAGPVFSAALKAHSPDDAAGTALGMMNGLCYLSVAALAHGAGLVLDHFQDQAVRTAAAWVYPRQAYSAFMLFCAVLGGMAAAAAWRIRDPQPTCATKRCADQGRC
jgi:MFS family permease